MLAGSKPFPRSGFAPPAAWTFNAAPTAGAGIELEPATHQLGQLTCDRETQPAPGGQAALEPVEALEDMGGVLRRDPGSVVLDHEPDAFCAGLRADDDVRSRRGVDERVLD